MLTAFQASTGAYMTEDGELLCESCFESEDVFAKPVSNYGLDEEQTASSEGSFDWDYADQIREVDGVSQALINDHWHVEACGCEAALLDANGHELREAYWYPGCAEIDDDKPSNPPVPRWVPCSQCGAGDGEPHRYGCDGTLRS